MTHVFEDFRISVGLKKNKREINDARFLKK